jgi:hypothetical protein
MIRISIICHIHHGDAPSIENHDRPHLGPSELGQGIAMPHSAYRYQALELHFASLTNKIKHESITVWYAVYMR